MSEEDDLAWQEAALEALEAYEKANAEKESEKEEKQKDKENDNANEKETPDAKRVRATSGTGGGNFPGDRSARESFLAGLRLSYAAPDMSENERNEDVVDMSGVTALVNLRLQEAAEEDVRAQQRIEASRADAAAGAERSASSGGGGGSGAKQPRYIPKWGAKAAQGPLPTSQPEPRTLMYKLVESTKPESIATRMRDCLLAARRVIVFDVETTGFGTSDRIIEIAAVEVVGLEKTGVQFQSYVRTTAAIHPMAEKVHGISAAFLSNKPAPAAVFSNFRQWVGDAPLVGHNVNFDSRFLLSELSRAGLGLIPPDRFYCTLRYFREVFPGRSASLDDVCSFLSVDTSMRTRHGALVDASLTADVCAKLLSPVFASGSTSVAASTDAASAPPLISRDIGSGATGEIGTDTTTTLPAHQSNEANG